MNYWVCRRRAREAIMHLSAVHDCCRMSVCFTGVIGLSDSCPLDAYLYCLSICILGPFSEFILELSPVPKLHLRAQRAQLRAYWQWRREKGRCLPLHSSHIILCLLFPVPFCLPHFQKSPLTSGALVSSSATGWTQTLAGHFAKGMWKISLILSCSSLSSLLVKINFSPMCDGHLSLLICLAICEPAW